MTAGSRRFGFWRGPVPCSGRFEDWTFFDKLRFMVKSQEPVVEAPACLHSLPGREIPTLPRGFQAERTLTLSGAGDLMRSDTLPDSGRALYGSLAEDLFGADLSIANLEAMVTRHNAGPLEFDRHSAPPLGIDHGMFAVLTRAGERRFNVLSMANNHTLDFGLEGVHTTLAALEAEKIQQVGINRSPEDQKRGLIIDCKGLRVGFLAATFGLNGHPIPPNHEHIVNVVHFMDRAGPVSLDLIDGQLKWLRGQDVDFVVASLHWGMEYECFPSAAQVALGRRLVDLGVDVVLGHHPHVVQPVEVYRPPNDSTRHGVICYSLGNLVNPFTAPYLVFSLVVRLRVVRGTLDGKRRTFIEHLELVPVFQETRGVRGNAEIHLHTLHDALYDSGLNDEQRANARASVAYADLVLGGH